MDSLYSLWYSSRPLRWGFVCGCFLRRHRQLELVGGRGLSRRHGAAMRVEGRSDGWAWRDGGVTPPQSHAHARDCCNPSAQAIMMQSKIIGSYSLEEGLGDMEGVNLVRLVNNGAGLRLHVALRHVV